MSLSYYERSNIVSPVGGPADRFRILISATSNTFSGFFPQGFLQFCLKNRQKKETTPNYLAGLVVVILVSGFLPLSRAQEKYVIFMSELSTFPKVRLHCKFGRRNFPWPSYQSFAVWSDSRARDQVLCLT